MRKLLVEFDDELDLWLQSRVNQAEAVRNAVRLYKGDISTDEDIIQGLRKSYALLLQKMDERFELYDESFRQLDKLIGYLETRM